MRNAFWDTFNFCYGLIQWAEPEHILVFLLYWFRCVLENWNRTSAKLDDVSQGHQCGRVGCCLVFRFLLAGPSCASSCCCSCSNGFSFVVFWILCSGNIFSVPENFCWNSAVFPSSAFGSPPLSLHNKDYQFLKSNSL